MKEQMTEMSCEISDMEMGQEIGGVDLKADENMMRLFGLVG